MREGKEEKKGVAERKYKLVLVSVMKAKVIREKKKKPQREWKKGRNEENKETQIGIHLYKHRIHSG